MRIVVALGRRAVARRGEQITVESQRASARSVAMALAPLACDHELVVSYGNGPQAEFLVMQAILQGTPADCTLDLRDAQTDVMTGYLLEQELNSALPPERPVATILNMVEVDPGDPAFRNPSTFIGPAYSKPQADELALHTGWAFRRDGDSWRRVVPSPRPGHIFEILPMKWLLKHGSVVLSLGGGGILAMYDHNHARALVGVDAVIEKDSADSLLARQLEADYLFFATDVPGVYRDWGKTEERLINDTTPSEIGNFVFDPASMGPKVRAACDFVRTTGCTAAIGALGDALKILTHKTGTVITPDRA